MLFSFNEEIPEYNAAVNYYSGELGVLAEGFKEAAELAIQEALRDSGKTDPLIFPIVYLYRHHLELRLKELMSKGNCIVNSSNEFDDGHHLGHLWGKVKLLAERICPVWFSKYKDDVDAAIQEFDRVDSQSMSFRYTVSTSKQGRESLVKSVFYIDLSSFKVELDPIISSLEDLHYIFDEHLES